VKYCWSLEWEKCLTWIFACVLVCRFLYPFYFNPVDQLWSDFKAHWEIGADLLSPHYGNGTDPKAYQVWIYVLRKLAADNNRSIISLITGLLCASLPYFWYRALREFCTRKTGLLYAILLGAHPSFLVMYGYFMIETVVLPATALAMWMTFRSARKQTLSSCMIAVVCWLITGFTKQMMVPVACIGMAYLLSFQPRKFQTFCGMVGLFTVFALPAGWHTYKAMGSVSPFGYAGRENINRDSGHTSFGLDMWDTRTGERWSYGWSSSSFYINPLEPLGNYTSYRIKSPYIVTIDLAHGMQDWDITIREAAQQHTFYERLKDIYENAIYFMFGPSWPDSDMHPGRPLHFLNWQLRWVFVFCITAILAFTPVCRMERPKMFITCIAFVMILLMLFQQTGVMEGRYRKPLEPFILLGTIFIAGSLLRRNRDDKSVSLREFIMESLTGGLSGKLLR